MSDREEWMVFTPDGFGASLFEFDEFAKRGVLTQGEYDTRTGAFERQTAVTLSPDSMDQLGEALKRAAAYARGEL
ncbi:hypothetical protein AB0H71_13945 [Nocardia sp. NPDC050697]|uniref:hypothetical protein n=1 Tax=Nocardia sp. NPDC050697 TaxID=3155158 RepID=UPI0033F43FBB